MTLLAVLKGKKFVLMMVAGDRLIARGAVRKKMQLKPGLLTTPKAHWPLFEGGLSMEVADATSDGFQTFRYKYDASYNVSVAYSVSCAWLTEVCG